MRKDRISQMVPELTNERDEREARRHNCISELDIKVVRVSRKFCAERRMKKGRGGGGGR